MVATHFDGRGGGGAATPVAVVVVTPGLPETATTTTEEVGVVTSEVRSVERGLPQGW